MFDFNAHRSELPQHGLTFLAEIPYVYHCHHFNLFHDQSLEDALGEEKAETLKVQAAGEAFHHLLSRLCQAAGASTPVERLQLAQQTFAWMGQGTIDLQAGADGGTARGEFLHYSFSWREKYGSKVKRLSPLDGVAAGFARAAIQVAYDLPYDAIWAAEESCYGMKAADCRFRISRQAESVEPIAVDQELEKARMKTALTGKDEERIAAITAGLREFLTGVAGDERGLVQAFNIFVSMHLPTYYNRTVYEALHSLEKSMPQAVPAAEALFGESGHVCVFYTFGNLLLSAEWEALVGALSGEVEDTVAYCCALARALGFGHWSIEELVPGERLVLRTPSTYEAPYYLARYGRSEKARSYFFANSARAIMQLAHRIDWKSKPQLTEDLYQSLFRSGQSWSIEQSQCLAKGDDLCETVVTRA